MSEDLGTLSCLDQTAQAKFRLGQIVATAGAQELLSYEDLLTAVSRHVRGDWGELDSEDTEVNERALKEGTRLFSAYHSSLGVRFYVITEWDRSVTTVLLPEEY